jgi:hypothetical protein
MTWKKVPRRIYRGAFLFSQVNHPAFLPPSIFLLTTAARGVIIPGFLNGHFALGHGLKTAHNTTLYGVFP